MKITGFDVFKVPPSWVWLRINTDTELVGWGEPYLENHPLSVIAEVRRLEQHLIGKDPTRTEALWHLMHKGGIGYVGGPVRMSAISGIDIALWDLAGKAAGVPIHGMLGGATRDRVRVYRAVGAAAPWCVEPGLPYSSGKPEGRLDISSSEMFRQSAQILTEEWGFNCLKGHFSTRDGVAGIADVDGIVESFAALKEGAGPDVDVAIDIHNPQPEIGSALIEALKQHRPLFVEEPVPQESIDALVRIGKGRGVPIAAGERWMGKWAFFEALSSGVLSVVQPDICHAGGITECVKIAAMAQAVHADLALHCPLSPLAFAASIQIDAWAQNFLVQEHNEVNDQRINGKTVIGEGFIQEPFIVGDDGCIAVPEGPGLGIAIDEEDLERLMAKPWSENRG